VPDPVFKALLLTEHAGETHANLTELGPGDLMDGDVLLDVAYSSLNYKDALAVTGKGKIARRFPLIPGVDLAGTVLESSVPAFARGDSVLATGWGLGETHHGGFARRARVKAEWLLPLPQGMNPQRAMAVGTAGLTAMLCVRALEEGGVKPGGVRPVLVTGASGGVGSYAVALLSALGYDVAAVTGKFQAMDYLAELGATEIISREEMDGPPHPLEHVRWAGAVDTVGGPLLARALAETAYGGTVAACGLAASHELSTTVMPFILRGVRLQGIESAYCPIKRRVEAWHRLQDLLRPGLIDLIARTEPLSAVPDLAQAMVAGGVQGRVVIDTSH
jgi:acrylyl-CoA reductase (NADPH)